jgi:hypothetical protein
MTAMKRKTLRPKLAGHRHWAAPAERAAPNLLLTFNQGPSMGNSTANPEPPMRGFVSWR